MSYFDLHVHPSLKGSLTSNLRRYNAWNKVRLFTTFIGILKSLRQTIDSQANLKQLKKGEVFSVVSFVAIEKAFAGNYVINKILASRIVAPLSRQLLNDVISGHRTYFHMFQRDLKHLHDAQKIKRFNILKKYNDGDTNIPNVVLSIEGAHCFLESEKESICKNFSSFKKNPDYRFLHLTLTHLTRQPSCVHCFGVKMKVIVNMMPDINFRPDPQSLGISSIGKEIIEIAYEESESSGKRILIDLKHMSYVSRQQFYEMRNGKWDHIPLIVSHAGVTGCRFEDARIVEIKKGKEPTDCDEVFWCSKQSPIKTSFNPWTINLFDNDIEQVIRSKGLIGISADERILGSGRIYGEYMSKLEVAHLNLDSRQSWQIPDGFRKPDVLTDEGKIFTGFAGDEEINDILAYEDSEKDRFKSPEDLGGDLLFDIDEVENAEEEESLRLSGTSHIDYLACNILHILKVGRKAGYSYNETVKCICLGSDLDGLINPINFPKQPGGSSIDLKKWLKANKYDRLKGELGISIERCVKADDDLMAQGINIADLLQKVMYTNGVDFLKLNFV